MYKILFVCSGNTCRSPLAQELLRKAISEDADLKDKVAVASCGIGARDDGLAEYNAIEAGKKYGVDLSSHGTHQLKPEMIDEFDAIIGMSTSHRDLIVDRLPDAKDKVFALYEYITGEKDCKNVHDPFGCDLSVYEKIAQELKEQIDLMVPIIKEKL